MSDAKAKKVSMGTVVQCPACGTTNFDLHTYESMMMLERELALFTLRCPHCQTVVSSVCVVPPDMVAQAAYAAKKLGAGLGQQASSL